MSPQDEIRRRTIQLIEKRTAYQKLTDTHHLRSPECAIAREEIAHLEESIRVLRSIRGHGPRAVKKGIPA